MMRTCSLRTHSSAPAATAFCLLLAMGALHAPADAQPAYGTFLQPGNAITRDTATVAIPAVIGADTVVRARFHVRYSKTATDSGMGGATVDELIVVDSAAPFETLWDCSDVPDQDSHNLRFYCTVLTSHGEWKGGPETFSRAVALDRNDAQPDKLLRAVHDTRPLAFDGDLREWHREPAITFTNGDNRITARACWNDRFLCLAIRVDDAAVFPSPTNAPPGIDTLMPVRLQDGVELFFDLLHDRSSVWGDDDYRMVIGASGAHTLHSSIVEPMPSQNPLLAVRRDDAGYSVEIGFSWEQLAFSPSAGSAIGLNIVNSDRETFEGALAVGSWAGISNLRHHNPSEWASLVLVRRHARWPWVLAAMVILAIVYGIVRRLRKRHALQRSAHLSPVLRYMMDFLEDNYHNDKLDSKAAAAAVHLDGPALSRIIRRETGKNFRELLNEFRLQKAKAMLLETDLAISEVSQRAGFTSPSQLSEVFSRFEHTTPSQYRTRKR